MKIIISPAKKMRIQPDLTEFLTRPYFNEDAKKLCSLLKEYDRAALKQLFKTNDEITEVNYRRYQDMDSDAGVTPAVLAYSGLQYQTMAPEVFTGSQWEYINAHLCIISGLYGLLRASDGVVPYRLEMQSRLKTEYGNTLYDYWKERIYQRLTDGEHEIINLASKEYSRAVEPYLKPEDVFVTCVFAQRRDGICKVKTTAAKMARGEMVRYMADRTISCAEELKEFDRSGYHFDEILSRKTEYVFLQEEA